MVDPQLGFSFLGVLLGTLCVIPLGVLVISSEYGTGMIRTTMTACPSRARVLTAKAIVFFGLAFVITTVTTTLVALFTSGMLYGPAPTTDQWLRATVGAGLYVSMLGLLALAVGSLLRHSAGAISTMLGVVLLPMLLAVFMPGSESLRKVSEALIDYSVPNSLATLYDIPFLRLGPGGLDPAVGPHRRDRRSRSAAPSPPSSSATCSSRASPSRRVSSAARYGTAGAARSGGPVRSSTPCASAGGRRRRRAAARRRHAAHRAGSPGRSRGSGSACAAPPPPTWRTAQSSPRHSSVRSRP